MLKKRLDIILSELYPHYSRQQIQSWIMQGLVTVDKTAVIKPGTQIRQNAEISLKLQEPKFVSRAGIKLEHALTTFNIDVKGLIALDAGISTGGFTDCLLQHGVEHVHGIDVGYGQVHEKIRDNPRVSLYERTNLRNLEALPNNILVDLITLDLSFISVLKVMPAVTRLLKPGGKLIILIKPQFEAQRKDIGKGGIIKDSAVHERVIQKIVAGVQSYNFILQNITPSPIEGSSGNKEFLAYFILNSPETQITTP